jgi:hypothetical protein
LTFYLAVFAMSKHSLELTYLNGPTALLEIGGLRLLTDPTFDPSDTTYPLAGYSLYKTGVTPIDSSSLGEIDAVLLSHDHHLDNFEGWEHFSESRTEIISAFDGAGLSGRLLWPIAGQRIRMALGG